MFMCHTLHLKSCWTFQFSSTFIILCVTMFQYNKCLCLWHFLSASSVFALCCLLQFCNILHVAPFNVAFYATVLPSTCIYYLVMCQYSNRMNKFMCLMIAILKFDSRKNEISFNPKQQQSATHIEERTNWNKPATKIHASLAE